MTGDVTDRRLEVLDVGALATVQDLGRDGLAALGVGCAGAADVPSLRLANRLLGNPEGHAAIEATFGGLRLRADGGCFVAVTGAPCPVAVDGRGRSVNAPVWVPDGGVLELGAPPCGLRSYVAVRGGIAVDPVLGSRSRDTLAGLGPEPLASGTVLPVGRETDLAPHVDVAPVPSPSAGEVTLRVVAGPRADWFTDAALAALTGTAYEVTAESDRVGMRLDGPVLERSRDDELPSEGMVAGALQVPPSGLPTLFLADHPVTGGYPVVAVVVAADVPLAAQARPGQHLRFRQVSP